MRELFKRIWSLLFGEEEVDLGSPLEIHQAINKVGTSDATDSQPGQVKEEKVSEEVATSVQSTASGEDIQAAIPESDTPSTPTAEFTDLSDNDTTAAIERYYDMRYDMI